MSLQDGADLATIIGLPAAGVGLFLTWKQIQKARRTTGADFLLRLRDAFRVHEQVNVNLRPEGIWSDGGEPAAEDWSAIDAYLGLFEVCEHMLKTGQLSDDMFRGQYLYRL